MTAGRALAAIDVGTNSIHLVVARPLGIGAFPGPRAVVASPRTLGWFDRNHVGPQLGQEEAGELSSVVGQIQYPVGREHQLWSSSSVYQALQPPLKTILPRSRCRRRL